MKKRYLALIFIGSVFTLIPFILWMSWVFGDTRSLSVFIMDKTSYTEKIVNNRALNWVLTHRKISKSDGALYSPGFDYYGFFPGKGGHYTIKDLKNLFPIEIDEYVNQYDMAYYTDSYGIFSDIWPEEEAANFPAQMIYGGLNASDFYFLEKMIQNNKLVIAELLFTSLATRTYHKQEAEDLFDLKWMGWTGRFFPDFDQRSAESSIPPWVITLYEDQYQKKWDITGMGVVLVHEDETLVILEYPKHIQKPVPMIKTTTPVRKHYNMQNNIPYPGWFEITFSSSDDGSALSWFDLQPTQEGLHILRNHHIPSRFPAVIRNKKKNIIYLPADYSISPVSRRMVQMKGSRYLELMVADLNNVSDKKAFFFGYYLPMMSQILKDYHNEIR